MELALNLVWLAVVVAAAAKFASWRRGQTAARQRMVALCTLCVLALLFPIVSATDDLHTDIAAAEETSAIRRAALSAVHLVSAFVAALPVVAGVRHHTATFVARVVSVDPPVRFLAGFALAASFRGPPSTSQR